VREHVSLEHLLIDFKFEPFDDDLSDAADEAVVRLSSSKSFDLGMSADEQSVIRVGRRDSRNADARLSEDVVDGQRDHVLGFDG
jgi:hypothetical protein